MGSAVTIARPTVRDVVMDPVTIGRLDQFWKRVLGLSDTHLHAAIISSRAERESPCSDYRSSHAYTILTARAAKRASIVSEVMDWAIISSLAHDVSGGVSVGENAVMVLNARNR